MKTVVLALATFYFAQSQAAVQKCEVVANGVSVPEGSYVEVDRTGPFIDFYRAKRQPDGSYKFIRMTLISADKLTSWGIDRKGPGCSEQLAQSNDLDFRFRCTNVGRYKGVNGFVLESAGAGHYYQSAITNGGGMPQFEIDFFACR